MIISHSQDQSVRDFRFIINILTLKLEPVTPLIRFSFKVGNSTVTSQPTSLKHSQIDISPLVAESEMVYSRSKGKYQPLRSLIRVFSVKGNPNEREELLGYADILLNEYFYMSSDIVHESELLNCPDWTAKIGFKLKIEEIYEESSPVIKRNKVNTPSNELLFATHNIQNIEPKEQQISILDEEGQKQQVNNQNDNSSIDNLNAYIEDLKSRVINLELQKNQSDKIIRRYQDKQNIFKRSIKQLEEAFETLKQELHQNKTAYEGLLSAINSSETPTMELIQQFITCKRCDILRGQIREKQKNYEDDLTVSEGLIKERDDEINRLHLRIDTLQKRSEVLRYKYKQCEAYQVLVGDIFNSLREKAKEMEVSIPELNLPDELLKVPQNLPSIFSNLLGRLQPHIGIVINGIQEQTQNGQKYQLWEDLKKKSGMISDLQFDLNKALEKINHLQLEANGYRQERDSLLSLGTAKFGQISFGRKESLMGRRDSDLLDIITKENQRASHRQNTERDSHKVDEEIDFLKRKNSELQEILNHQQKILENQKLEMTIQSKQLEIRTDLQKRIQRSLQNEIEIEKQLHVKDSIIDNLRLTIEQYQQDVEELKEKLVEDTESHRRSRQKIQIQEPVSVENPVAELEGDIKNLLMSLDKEDEENSIDLEDDMEHEDKNNLVKRVNNEWTEIPTEVKASLQKKIKLLSIQFLKMKSLKVERCKSKEQTQQLMRDFVNFRNKLEDAIKYIDNL